MKRILLALSLAALPLYAQQGPQDIHPFFSPNGGCTEAVVSALDGAKKTVLVQAYRFTSAPIAKALVDAKHRGVDVQVILDKSQRTARYTSATFLANEGVPTYIDSSPQDRPQDRPQQGHDHRWPDGHHRELQLHQECGGRKCREPSGDQQCPGACRPVCRQLEGASGAFTDLHGPFWGNSYPCGIDGRSVSRERTHSKTDSIGWVLAFQERGSTQLQLQVVSYQCRPSLRSNRRQGLQDLRRLK